MGFYICAHKNQLHMETQTTAETNKTRDWLLFAISTIILILMLLYLPQWFWLALPFSCTYLVKALDVM